MHVPSADCDRILDLARNASEPNWLTVGMPGIPLQLAGVVESERAAKEIFEWSPMLVPGLAQTSEYVRVIAEAHGLPRHEVESRVMVRAARREILAGRDPVHYDLLLDETALLRPIGPPDVMTDQLRHLIELGGRPNVTVRIVPHRVPWHPGTAGPFVLYSFPDAPPLVHFENHSSGAFVTDSDDVEAYWKAIDIIGSYALDQGDSTRLIAQIMVDEWSAASGQARVVQEQLQ